MQLALLPGKDVAVPVRFGGSASPLHDLVLRFGPMEHDGTVPGHLVVSVGQEHLAARRAVVWDPVLCSFSWGNQYDAERIAERFDPTTAFAGLAAVIDGSKRSCDGERVAVAVTRAALSPAVEARMVELTMPGGGSCFGQPGSNAYFLAKAGGGWRRLLSAVPGSISVLNTRHNGYADLELNSLGTCVYVYRWTGSRYVQAGSPDCATAAPPTMGTLPGAIRGRP